MYEPLEIATDLLIHSSKQLQAWFTRFVVVNAALFSAVGVMVTWGKPPHVEFLAFLVIVAICAIGTVTSCVIFGVILRQIWWTGRQLNLVFALQKELNVQVHVLREPGGLFQETFAYVLGIGVPIVWLALAVIVVQASPYGRAVA